MGVFRVSIFAPRRIEILGIRPKPVRSASRSRTHHAHHHPHRHHHKGSSEKEDTRRPRTATDGNDMGQPPELQDEEEAGIEEMNSPIANADTSLRQQKAAKEEPAKSPNETLQTKTNVRSCGEEGKTESDAVASHGGVAIARSSGVLMRRESINATVSFHHHHHQQRKHRDDTNGGRGGAPCSHRRVHRARSGGEEKGRCCGNVFCGESEKPPPPAIDFDHPPADVEIVSKIVRETAGGPDRLYEVAFRISPVFRPTTVSSLGGSRKTNGDPCTLGMRGTKAAASASAPPAQSNLSRDTSFREVIDVELALRRLLLETIPKVRCTWTRCSSILSSEECEDGDGDNCHEGGPPFGDDMDNDVSFVEVVFHAKRRTAMLMAQQAIEYLGIGRDYGHVSIIECDFFRPMLINRDECWVGVGGSEENDGERQTETSEIKNSHHRHKEVEINPVGERKRQNSSEKGNNQSHGQQASRRGQGGQPGAPLTATTKGDGCTKKVNKNKESDSSVKGVSHLVVPPPQNPAGSIVAAEGLLPSSTVGNPLSSSPSPPFSVLRRTLSSQLSKLAGRSISISSRSDSSLTTTMEDDSAVVIEEEKNVRRRTKSEQKEQRLLRRQREAGEANTKGTLLFGSKKGGKKEKVVSLDSCSRSEKPPVATAVVLSHRQNGDRHDLGSQQEIADSNDRNARNKRRPSPPRCLAALTTVIEMGQSSPSSPSSVSELDVDLTAAGEEKAFEAATARGEPFFDHQQNKEEKTSEQVRRAHFKTRTTRNEARDRNPRRKPHREYEAVNNQEEERKREKDSSVFDSSRTPRRVEGMCSDDGGTDTYVTSRYDDEEDGHTSLCSLGTATPQRNRKRSDTISSTDKKEREEDEEIEMEDRTTNDPTTTTTSPLLHFSTREGITGAGGGVSASGGIGGGFGGGGGVGGGVGISNLMSQLEDDEEGLDIAAQMRFDAVLANICANALVDFDFIAFLIISIVVGGLGLATNSPVSVLAAALLSPMMGPILATVMGTILVVQSRAPSLPSLRAHIKDKDNNEDDDDDDSSGSSDQTEEDFEGSSYTMSYTGSSSCSTCSSTTSDIETRTRSPCVPQEPNPFVARHRERTSSSEDAPSTVTAVRRVRRKGRPTPASASSYGNQSLRKKGIELLKLGFKVELLVLVTALTVGFIIGLAFWGSDKRYNWDENGTDQMKNRATPSVLITGIFIAFCSGSGLVLSLLGSRGNSLVGVALNASLLPPVVNSGMYFALAIRTTVPSENVERALFSLALTCINVAGIYVAALFMFFAKRFTPFAGVGWDFGDGPEGKGAVTTGKAIYRGGMLGQRAAAVVREAKEREEAAKTTARAATLEVKICKLR